jgi:cholesterol transport system auxiliary component
MTIARFVHEADWALRLAALVVLMAGCSALQPVAVEAPKLHLLEAKPIAVVAAGNRNLVLAVSTPRASPGFDTPQMAYVKRPYGIEYFANSRWVDAPARMLGPLLVRAMEQSGGFRVVVPASSAVPADLRLDTELIRLQQDFSTQPSRAALALWAQLIDVRTRRVLATKMFEATANAPADNAYGGVTAANAALQQIIGEVAAFCIAESGGDAVQGTTAP